MDDTYVIVQQKRGIKQNETSNEIRQYLYCNNWNQIVY